MTYSRMPVELLRRKNWSSNKDRSSQIQLFAWFDLNAIAGTFDRKLP